MTADYERPQIKRLRTGTMNKFGIRSDSTQAVRRAIDGVTIAHLCQEYGSPLFVYSERTLRQRYQQIRSAFATRYPDVTFGWSYKTNYLKAICSIFHQEGAVAEIVSAMEYEKASELGLRGKEIIFNGPHKPKEVLRKAAREGVRLHIDHDEELADLEEIAEELGRPIEVGLRLNLDAGIVPQWSRFGYNLESGQALKAARRIARGGLLRLTGIHSHIGTFILDPDAYRRQIVKMIDFAYAIEDEFGDRIEYLDIGGGLPSKSRLKGTYHAPDVLIPPIDEFAETICNALHDNLRPGHRPKLIVEAGRAMVDDSGYLISSIVAAKQLPDGTRAYVADAGINLLFTSAWYKFTVETEREKHGLQEPCVLYGPMCMNIDVLDEAISLPPLDRGERLIFSPVGAYNNTQWMQFIEYRPNVVLIGTDGQVHLIREREDKSDFDRRERMPDHLAPDGDAEQQVETPANHSAGHPIDHRADHSADERAGSTVPYNGRKDTSISHCPL